MVMKVVAGVAGLRNEPYYNALAKSATTGDPAETAGNPIDCRTSLTDTKQLAKLRALLITIGRDRRRPRELRRHAESIITLIDGRGIDPIRSTHFAYTYRLFKWAAAGAPERAMLPPAQIAAAFQLGHQ